MTWTPSGTPVTPVLRWLSRRVCTGEGGQPAQVQVRAQVVGEPQLGQPLRHQALGELVRGERTAIWTQGRPPSRAQGPQFLQVRHRKVEFPLIEMAMISSA